MYQGGLRGHLFEAHIQWNCSFTLISFAYGMQKGEILFVLLMESVYLRLSGELFHRPRPKAGVSCRCYELFYILHCMCFEEFHKSGLLLSKKQPAEAEFQQHSLGGRRRSKEESITAKPLQLKVQGHGVALDIKKFLRKLEQPQLLIALPRLSCSCFLHVCTFLRFS